MSAVAEFDDAPPGIAGVVLDGRDLEVALSGNVCNAADEVETMGGASTFTLRLLDPEGELETSGLFDYAVDVELPPEGDDDRPRVFRLVSVDSQFPVLTVTFEDRDVARLRKKRKYRKASRSRVTRAEFFLMLVREVKADRIGFYAPELHKRQRIAKADPEKKESKKDDRRGGFAEGEDLQGHQGTLRAAQLRTAAAMLDEADKLDPPMNALRALVIAGMIEGPDFKNPRRGGAGGAYAGPLQYNAAGFGMDNARNPRWVTRHFLTKGATGAGGAIEWARKGLSPAAIINKIHNPGGQHFYEGQGLRDKADAIIEAWGGGGGGGGSERQSYTKRFEYKRGEPGKPEDSWTAMGRLADEVRWRRFMRRGVLWYASETWLIKRRAVLVLSRQSQGVQKITYKYDLAKKAQTATVVLYAKAWPGHAGDVVALRGVAKAAVGRYLVETVRRSRFSPLVTLELKRETKPLPEPRSETATRDSDESSNAGDATGKLAWPTESHNVTSVFGPRSSPGGVGSTNHDGIDIGVAVGTKVMAADGGEVTRAGAFGGYGNYVEIDHGDGLATFYGHLNSISVRTGQKVRKGQKIGESGNTGTSTGPHLHFGAHKNGKPTNPRSLLPRGGAPSRASTISEERTGPS